MLFSNARLKSTFPKLAVVSRLRDNLIAGWLNEKNNWFNESVVQNTQVGGKFPSQSQFVFKSKM